MFGFVKRYFELRRQRRIATFKVEAKAFCLKYFEPLKTKPLKEVEQDKPLSKTAGPSFARPSLVSELEVSPKRAQRKKKSSPPRPKTVSKPADDGNNFRYSISTEESPSSYSSDVRYSIASAVTPNRKICTEKFFKEDVSWYVKATLKDTFVERLLRFMREKGFTAPKVYRSANMSKQLFSKIISNLEYKPSRDTAIVLAFALQLTFEQAQDFIGRAGFTLTHSDERDLILEYFLKEKYYKLLDINVVLHEMGKKLLGS